MQVQQTTTRKDSSLFNLNKILSKSAFRDRFLSNSSALSEQKNCDSQIATRETSNASNSSREELSLDSLDSDFENAPQFQMKKHLEDEEDDCSSFHQRSSNEFRRGYINRLVNMKVMDLQPKKKNQHISIFDWDDTLFCTSFIGDQPFHKVPADIKDIIKVLDTTASKILARALRMSEVYIITNSDIRWIRQSAQMMLPLTHDLITRKNIKIVSARNEYSALYPNDMCRWKLEAFLKLKNEFETDAMTNIVVLGDSDMELRAAKQLGMQFKQTTLKTVKFEENPTIEELIKQQKVVLNLFDEIFAGSKNLSVRLGKTQNDQ